MEIQYIITQAILMPCRGSEDTDAVSKGYDGGADTRFVDV